MKLHIGNRVYSSWSLRGWLACRLSGLEFETVVTPLYDEAWEDAKQGPVFAPSAGKVPILWDGDVPIWESLAIVDWLADRVGPDRFWPAEPAARALARSMAAEMHAGYQPLRAEHGMNLRRRYAPAPLSDAVAANVARIEALWAEARDRFGKGGPYLFGDFNAADAMFAPVVTRFVTYSIPLSNASQAYVDAVLDHPWMREWHADAAAETWVIAKFERP